MADSILSVLFLGNADSEEMGKYWLKRGVAPLVISGNVEDSKYVQLLGENINVLEVSPHDYYKVIRNNDCEDFLIASIIDKNGGTIITTVDGQSFDLNNEIEKQLNLLKNNSIAR